MFESERMLANIEKYGMIAKGRRELVSHLSGERLTLRKMALAKCYDCMGFFSDGRGQDCETSCCPLYPVMPYRKQGEKYTARSGGKKMSDEQKVKMVAGQKNRFAK